MDELEGAGRKRGDDPAAYDQVVSAAGVKQGGQRQAVMILADGARDDVFRQLLEAGELPEIQQHIVDRGSFRTATSTFTSTTIPAHLPFLTGRFAGSADIPGYRWYDGRNQRRGGLLGPWSFRNYNGVEARHVNDDVAADAPTLFELAPGSQSVYSAITRGVAHRDALGSRRKNLVWLRAHFMHNYRVADESARRLLRSSLKHHAPFRFVVLPGIDWNSHYVDPFGKATLDAYRRVDRTVGEAVAALQRAGRYEQTLLAVVSDHGHEPVREHFDIGPEIAAHFGVKTAYHSLKALRFDPDVISAVSGNAMAHLYFNRRPDGLVEWLLRQPAVDIVAERLDDGEIGVVSRRGQAVLREHGELLVYEPGSGDPFGYPDLPRPLDHDQALALTAHTDYPDGLLQLAQIFRSERCGDVVVSAAPGYDLRRRYERPAHLSSHGGLYAAHMNVPLAISAELEPGVLRTADVFSCVTDYLGLEDPPGVDGRSRLLRSERARPTRSAAP